MMRFEGITPQRWADETDFSDLTASVQTGAAYWDPETPTAVLVVPMDPEPTEAEATAIRRRLVTADAAEEAHLRNLLAAHADTSAPMWARVTIAAELARYGEPA